MGSTVYGCNELPERRLGNTVEDLEVSPGVFDQLNPLCEDGSFSAQKHEGACNEDLLQEGCV